MTLTLSNYTRYFGFITVMIEWLMVILCLVLVTPNLAEPFSQYGTYPQTKYVFAGAFTLASIVYYFFSRHLDPFWKHTSHLAIIAGLAFTITGWVPYQPYAGKFILDVHNVALVVAILCFTLPMLFIGFSRKHHLIAQISKFSFLWIFITTIISFIARTTDVGVIYSQIVTLVIFHVWLVVINILLLKHHRTTDHKL